MHAGPFGTMNMSNTNLGVESSHFFALYTSTHYYIVIFHVVVDFEVYKLDGTFGKTSVFNCQVLRLQASQVTTYDHCNAKLGMQIMNYIILYNIITTQYSTFYWLYSTRCNIVPSEGVHVNCSYPQFERSLAVLMVFIGF